MRHIEMSARGSKPWQPAFGTAGAVQNKVADATMAAAMSFSASMGHSLRYRFQSRKTPEGASRICVGKNGVTRFGFPSVYRVYGFQVESKNQFQSELNLPRRRCRCRD